MGWVLEAAAGVRSLAGFGSVIAEIKLFQDCYVVLIVGKQLQERHLIERICLVQAELSICSGVAAWE